MNSFQAHSLSISSVSICLHAAYTATNCDQQQQELVRIVTKANSAVRWLLIHARYLMVQPRYRIVNELPLTLSRFSAPMQGHTPNTTLTSQCSCDTQCPLANTHPLTTPKSIWLVTSTACARSQTSFVASGKFTRRAGL